MQFPIQAARDALAAYKSGWELIDARQLSPRVAKLKVCTGHGIARDLILLCHGQGDRRINPDIPRQEYSLLQSLSSAGLAVPRPLLLDASKEIPFLITECVTGATCFAATDIPAFCRQLARILSDIHHFNIKQHDLSFLPSQSQVLAADLREATADDYGIGARLRAAAPQIALNGTVLLHGDFWLGNLLWRGEHLAAIIDWEDAMLGDPLADLGKSRLEVLWALGEGALEWYTAAYQARNPALDYSALPFWDLWGALRLAHFAKWSTADVVARRRAQYERFIGMAAGKLSPR